MESKQINTLGAETYFAPTVDAIAIAAEKGFADSLNNNEDYTGGDVEQI